MGITVRMATADDIDAIARLTAAGRRRLAGWAPRWWAPAEGADDLHPLWLRHLVEADGPVVRVADDGGTVVGCAVSLPQPGQWAVDDLQVADGRWPDAGAALLAAVAERPALHCAASADADRLAACAASGLTAVSRYWIGPPTPAGHTPAGPSPAGPTALPAPVPLAGGTPVPPGPPHTFGAALDPHAPGAVALTDGAGGVVVASPPSPAPPVYDPDGTVTVIDRLTGDRPRLLDAALAAVAARGDVLVAVVAAPDDDGLATLLADRGLSPTVDVLAWPLTRVPTA